MRVERGAVVGKVVWTTAPPSGGVNNNINIIIAVKIITSSITINFTLLIVRTMDIIVSTPPYLPS